MVEVRMRWSALAVWLVACSGGGPADDTSDTDIVDADGDGDGFTEDEGDCNDRDDLIYPGADDTPYDGIDSDCAEDSDYDADGDGYDSDDHGGDDCDDTDDSVYPGAEDEPYDGVDADCAEDSDYDADGDGQDSDDHGGTDCDDEDELAYDGADERCNGKDDDCDTLTDEADAIDQPTWYYDFDGDGHGDPDVTAVQCDAPTDYVDNGDDCDDDNGAAYPGATFVECDGAENDCDFTTREAPVVKLDGSVVADLPTALDGATDNSTIEVCEGLHQVTTGGVDDLIITVPLTLTGLGDPEHTIIEAVGSNRRLIRVQAVQATISNVTLTGGLGWGYDTGFGATDVGGGVLGEHLAQLSLTDVVVTGNAAADGGGIYIGQGGVLNLLRVEVHGNDASSGSGGGIIADEDADVFAEDTEVWGNSAVSGGGVGLWYSGAFHGNGSTTIGANETSLGGAGMRTWSTSGTPPEITGVTITANDASNTGGGVYSSGDLDLSDSVVSFNHTSLNGGGLTVTGWADLDSVVLEGNTSGHSGAALYMNFDETATLVDCTVIDNVASFPTVRGAVVINGGTIVSTNTDWGSGDTDNLPWDVVLDDAALELDFDGLSTFTCTDEVGTTCP